MQGAGRYARADLELAVTVKDLFGATVKAYPPVTGAALPNWESQLPTLLPGQTLAVEASLRAGDTPLDFARTFISRAGQTPRPTYAPAVGPVLPWSKVLVTETLNIFEQVETNRSSVDAFLKAFRERKADAVQLNTNWMDVEFVRGAYDWRRLDAYVQYLTENRVPFVFGTMGSALFMGMPVDTWGEWMTDQTGNPQLWRNLPVVTPTGPAYRAAVREFVGHMVERYRGNPYLLGYNFINQGADSAVYFDITSTITDYSPWSRRDLRRFLARRYPSLEALNRSWKSQFATWDEVQPPMPDFTREVDLSPEWKDFTAWKIEAFRQAIPGLFDDVVRARDSKRDITHYAAYTGPVEYLFRDFNASKAAMADGGGEDITIGRLNSLSAQWKVERATESHEVPPNNAMALRALTFNATRYGMPGQKVNLVWNSLVSLHVTRYPKEAPLLESMAWWKEAVPVLKNLRDYRATTPRVGAILSWPDMFYRTRVWRWFQLPGYWMDSFSQASNAGQVAWLSEITPASSWKGLKWVVVPPDARVLDVEVQKRLAAYAREGGAVLFLGSAGRWSTDGREGYHWLAELGQPNARVTAKSGPGAAAVNWMGQKLELAAPFTVEGLAPATRAHNRTDGAQAILDWDFGKGKVCWILSEPERPQWSALELALRQWSGDKPDVLSGDQRIQGFWMHNGQDRVLTLSHFLGFGDIRRLQASGAPVTPVKTRVQLPGLPTGNWRVEWLLPARQARTMTSAQLAQGLEVEIRPTDLQFVHFRRVK